MKYLLFIFLFFIGSYAQAQEETNPFSSSERQSETTFDEKETPNAGLDIGNPGGEDDLPIDDYIPLLVVTAIAFIIFKEYKRRNVVS